MPKQDQICQQLLTLVNPDQVQPWNAIAAPLQDQISQAIAPTHTPACIVYPQTQDELAELVACSHANRWTILPCGNATKLHWGGVTDSVDVVISTARLTQIIEHAVGDLTITVEAGLTFNALQHHLAPLNQWLPIDPTYAETATLGGILATANAGVLRQRYGGARDMLIGVSIVRADGVQAKAGGRVVKNVAGYDLMKLFTGSWGTLGIISQVTLRLYPQPSDSRTVCLTGSITAIESVAAALLGSSLTPTSATVISAAMARQLCLDPIEPDAAQASNSKQNSERKSERAAEPLTLMVRFQSIPVSIEQQGAQVLTWGQQEGLQSQICEGDQETALWQQLHVHTAPVTCKVGVVASKAVSTLAHCNRLAPGLKGWINTGNGLGMVHMPTNSLDPDGPTDSHPSLTLETVQKMRSLCELNDGFLSLLAAPQDWKQKLTSVALWGYSGNAQPIMQKIKEQFDPSAILSPGRFLV